ncbi:hypothetical protein Ancab_026088 [Ancistrocladus abbreviatus]
MQGIKQDEEIRKVQRENKARVIREGKEQRKKWAERLTPRPRPLPQPSDEVTKNEIETEARRESQINDGMLPEGIVNLLAAREKQVFLSDSDEEEKMEKKPKPKKKRPKKSGFEPLYIVILQMIADIVIAPYISDSLMNNRVDPIILKEIAPAYCVQNSLEFLKKRKLQVELQATVAASLLVYGEEKVSSMSKHLGSTMEAAKLVEPFINQHDNFFIEWFRRRYEMKLTGDCMGFSFGKKGCFFDIVKDIRFQ